MTWLKRLKFTKRQGGFTLIELLVGIVLASLISMAVMMTFAVMLRVNASSEKRVTAIRQVQNAGMWVSQDIQAAQQVILGGGHFFEAKWYDWDTAQQYDVKYDVVNGDLKRSYSINGGNPAVTVVASYIDLTQSGTPPKALTRIEQTAGSYTLTVTSTLSGFSANGQPVSETRTYVILPRP